MAKACREPQIAGLKVSEKELMRAVVKLAELTGWRVYHTWLSIRSEPGFPDLVLVRPPRLVFAELKSEKGELTPSQQAWLEDLGATKAEVYVWRPSDWDQIVSTLARGPTGES
jgi:hypothetical protein